MANLATETWLRFVIWLVLGLAIYFLYSRRHARLATREPSQAEPARPRRAAEG